MGLEDRPYLYESGRRSPFDRSGRWAVVTWIVIINVGIWIVDSFPNAPLTTIFALDSNLFRDHYLVFTLLTSGFLHAPLAGGGGPGFFHIAFNMFTLWMLGRMVEMHLGRKEFLRFYLVSIVVAGAGWLIVTLATTFPPIDHPQRVVGASGGVTAVVILFVFTFPKNTLSIYGIFNMPAWLFGLLLVVYDLWRALAMPNSGVAVSAHLTGAAFGAVYHLAHWNLRFMAFPFSRANWKMPRRKPKLKVHRPKTSEDDKLSEQADKVLDKLHREGESSLNAKERRILESYSRKVRQNRSNE